MILVEGQTVIFHVFFLNLDKCPFFRWLLTILCNICGSKLNRYIRSFSFHKHLIPCLWFCQYTIILRNSSWYWLYEYIHRVSKWAQSPRYLFNGRMPGTTVNPVNTQLSNLGRLPWLKRGEIIACLNFPPFLVARSDSSNTDFKERAIDSREWRRISGF